MNNAEIKINIRKASQTDVKKVHKLVCQLENTFFDYEIFTQMYESNIRDPRNIYLVAEFNGATAGFLSCHSQMLLHHLDMVYEIQEMITDPDFRKLGIGRNLLRFLEKEVRLRNGKLLEVCSNKLRDRAHEFYQFAGFNRTHYKFTKKINA